MHDELTAQDIEQMRAELKERKTTALPELIKAVQEARAFGDLSENFEYKAAKQELNKCKRRIRYLEGVERRQRNHRLITRGAAVEHLWPEVKALSEQDFYSLMELILSLAVAQDVLRSFLQSHPPKEADS